MERTKEQKKAIMLNGCNILVAAAAGSGKTSVLVERILTKVSAKEHPVDIDRLLVVTFTNAAAAEMRERMEKALEEKFEKEPENKNLQKQMALLHRSHIMTIDSFCGEVLRNHFQEIDLDPACRIADHTELKLLWEDVLSEVLEELYQEPERVPGFLQFMDSYAPGRSDKAAEDVIFSVYQAASAYPDPKGWILEKRKEMQDMAENAKPEGQAWMEKLLLFLHSDLESCAMEAERLLSLCSEAPGLSPYADTLRKDLDIIEELVSLKTYQEYAKAFSELAFVRLGTLKKADKAVADPELMALVKDGRDTVKKALQGMRELYFPESGTSLCEGESAGDSIYQELCRELSGMAVPMTAMYDVVLVVMEAYQKAKRERNLMDFSDQEHMALQILVRPDGTPTGAALELREFFEEILIDEYQDSNRLQEVILKAIARENNMFLVGDVKQSIYRFRLARPELFMEKYHTYAACDIEDTFGAPESESHKIDLGKNFRSGRQVIDTVNYLFSRIMGKKLGNIEYDHAAALYCGRADCDMEELKEAHKTELLYITPEEAAEEAALLERGKIELEAAHVAKRIAELVSGKENGYRVEYGDIAVLLRTMSGWSETFLKTFQEAGIPAVTATAKGYFEAMEVRILLNLCRLIDNEQQDIPLVSVMLSPIGGFCEGELSLLRSRQRQQAGQKKKGKQREDTFFAACTEFLKQEQSGEKEQKLQEKLRGFFGQIARFRDLSACLTVPELLEQVLMITGYDDCVRVMPDGEKRYENVRMLIKKAGDFEQTSYHGLFQFNRYMERLKQYEIDFGEADTAGNDNAVRIMSIHKSKGLEFPVVFVSGLGKQFNFMDTRRNVVVHQELGAGADLVDLERRIQVPTVLKRVLQKDMTMEMIAEELRVLYVAMTRAENKLILTGYLEDAQEKIRKWRFQGETGKLSNRVLGSARTFFDLIMPVFLQPSAEYKTGFDSCPVEVKESNYRHLLVHAASSEETREWKRQELLHHMEAYAEDAEQVCCLEIKKYREERYLFEKSVQLKTKFTVSELKRASMEEWEEETQGAYLEQQEALFSWNLEGAITRVPERDALFSEELLQRTEQMERTIPSFIKEKEEKGGAFTGTLYHKAMQRLNFMQADSLANVKEQLHQLLENGIFTQEEFVRVKPVKIWKFLSQGMGKRLSAAQKEGKLFREQPFVMGKEAQIFTGERESTDREEDTVLVQGVIDLFFEEDGKIVLLDYKTDRVQRGEELREKYQRQLEYYEEALTRARNMKVEEKYLYSFYLEELVEC